LTDIVVEEEHVARARGLVRLATAVGLLACSTGGAPGRGGGGSFTEGSGGMYGVAGQVGSGGQQTTATGGARASTGGSAALGTGGVTSDGAGGAATPSGGVEGTGGVPGAAGGAGPSGSGGLASGGGSRAGAEGRGTGGSGGTGGGGGASPAFVCHQVTGMTLTREWFEAGYQQDPGITDGRWQLKAREHGYITEWANATSDFWNEMIESPCASSSGNPDHVVLTVLSWNPACCTTQPQWDAQIDGAVTNLVAKYSGLKRIDLMTVIRGPGNMLCPMAPAANETIVMPPELDAALTSAAAKFPGLVYVTPKFEAASCSAFSGGGPHLTTAGNTAVAKDIAAYFSNLR
jgi:hypothetical protein